jgi:hypothetical protein
LREAIAWGDTQLKVHLARLLELEYLVAHRAAHGAFDYELVYETSADHSQAHVAGLIDIEALRAAYDADRSGQNGVRSGVGRGVVGPRSAGGRVEKIPANAVSARLSEESAAVMAKTHTLKPNGKTPSYPTNDVVASSLVAAVR